MQPSQEQKPPEGQSEQQPREESRRQPAWHVVVLCVLTLFAYSVVWFYKTWCLLVEFAPEAESSEDFSKATKAKFKGLGKTKPWVWTLFVILPGMQMIAATRLFSDIVQIYPQPVPVFREHPVWVGASMMALMVGLLCLAQLHGLYYLLFLTAAIPLACMQQLLNRFWEKAEPPGLLYRQAFTVGELVSLIVGSLILGLVVTGQYVHKAG